MMIVKPLSEPASKHYEACVADARNTLVLGFALYERKFSQSCMHKAVYQQALNKYDSRDDPRGRHRGHRSSRDNWGNARAR